VTDPSPTRAFKKGERSQERKVEERHFNFVTEKEKKGGRNLSEKRGKVPLPYKEGGEGKEEKSTSGSELPYLFLRVKKKHGALSAGDTTCSCQPSEKTSCLIPFVLTKGDISFLMEGEREPTRPRRDRSPPPGRCVEKRSERRRKQHLTLGGSE